MKKLLPLLLFISCTAEMPSDNYTPISKQLQAQDLEVLNLLNEIRVAHNLSVLTPEKTLTDSCAYPHTAYMSALDNANHDYFYVRFTKSHAKYFGELVAYNYQTSASYVSAYVNSPKHYEQILNPKYTHIGIAHTNNYQCIELAGYK